jgi:type IV secretion system protein TrbL
LAPIFQGQEMWAGMMGKKQVWLGLVTCLSALAVAHPAHAEYGQVLTELENQVSAAAKGWETSIMQAARSLFWILAGIEIGIAAVWLALQSAALDAWFAELVRRIMFVGFFAFVLAEGPDFAKAIVDSLYSIGASGGTASPAGVFDAGIRVAALMSQQAKFGVFENNALATAVVMSMCVVVVCFSLVAAIFVAVMVEMYVGLLAGMIMLGLGGSSFTKDFAIRYLVYAFSVGMKLMALVMIARIGSDTLLGLAKAPTAETDQLITTLAIAGISIVVFMVAMYVPNIMQGVVQGVSVTGGMEVIRHGGQAASAAAGAVFLATGSAAAGATAARSASAAGASAAGALAAGTGKAAASGMSALASAAKAKAVREPGAHAGSLMGLANAKLDAAHRKNAGQAGKTQAERHQHPSSGKSI